MSGDGRLRLALLLEALGLAVEGVSLMHLGPGTFVLFTIVGMPLIVAGMVLFGIHVVQELTRAGVL